MRSIFILFLLASCSIPKTIITENKETYTDTMSVLETSILQNTRCSCDIEVHWGVYLDTLAFSYENKSIYFYSVSKQVWEQSGISRRKVNDYLATYDNQYPNNISYVLQDKFDEKYHILISQSPTALLIGISNIEHGYPNYMFYRGKDKFCN